MGYVKMQISDAFSFAVMARLSALTPGAPSMPSKPISIVRL
jgi:hypothetical protein